MGDPRNVAHAKKVSQEKHHKAKTGGKSAVPAHKEDRVEPVEIATTDEKSDRAELEKSIAVLAKLKEMEFHSRANIEKLAELTLTIEDELKQKAFVQAIGAIYSAEESFHSKITEFIETYQAECDRLKPAV